MNMLNNLSLEGTITKDVELTETENGNAVAKSAMASSRYFKTEEGEEKEEVTTIDFVCFGKMAENLARISKTKRNVRIVGRLKNQDDKIIIVAEHIEYKAK